MPWAFLLWCLSGVQLAFPGPFHFQQPGNESREAAAGHSEKLFQRFVVKYNRSYSAGSLQFIHKYHVFQQNVQRHETMNLFSSNFWNESGSAVYGINQFSDMSPEVFRATYLGSRSVQLPKYTLFSKNAKKLPLPPKFDWRDKNVVTPVRNQESSKAKLVKESVYPFNAKTGLCRYFSRSALGVSITGFKAYSFRYNEDVMMEKLLEWGPLVAVVDAVSWQDYLGGIIQHHCSQGQSNHAVVITGYDATGDTPYWIVRNSWGTKWGVDGYVYIKMGKNVCGIADSVAVAFV